MKTLKFAAIRIIRRRSQLGIAIAIGAIVQTALIFSVATLPVVEKQAAAQTVENLSSSDNWITLNLGDVTKLGDPEFSNFATSSFKQIENAKLQHSVVFRPISDGADSRFQLIATDSLEKEFKIINGKLPTQCNQNLCEVLVENFDTKTQLPTNFRVVGTAEILKNSSLLTALEPDAPRLITSDNQGVLSLQVINGYPGSELWAIPISTNSLHAHGLDQYLNQLADIKQNATKLNGRFLLSGPLGIFDETKSQVKVLSNRIISLEIAICLIALLIIFVMASAAANANEEFVASINRIAPNELSYKKFNISLAVLCVVASLLFSLISTLLLQAIFFKNYSVGSDYLGVLVFNLISSTLIIYAAHTNSNKEKIILIFLIGLGWLIIAISEKLNLELALIAGVCGLIFYFVFGMLKKLPMQLFTKNIFLNKKSQFLALGLITSLLVSTILATVTYSNSLQRNAIDAAVFASPTKTRITMSSEAQPMQFNSFQDYQAYSSNSQVFGVRKQSTTFASSIVDAKAVQLIGVDPTVWNFVPNIVHQTGFDLTKSTSLLKVGNPDLGIELAGKQTIELKVSGLNEHTTLSAWLLNNRSESFQLQPTKRNDIYEFKLPETSKNLLGFQITEDADFKARRDHAVGEGENALPAPMGQISLTNLVIDKKIAAENLFSDFDYSVINGPVYLSLIPKVESIPALIDSTTAAEIKNNNLQLKVTGEYSISLTNVGAVKALPTSPMRFALVDDNLLTQYLASTSPELLHITEVWIAGNLKSNLSANKELFGLTVFDQDVLAQKNINPVNSKWTKNALWLIVALSILLEFMVVAFLTRNIFGSSQIFGWRASGTPISKLRNNLFRQITAISLISVILSSLTSIWLIRIYVEENQYNINGEIAYPPIISFFKANDFLVINGIFVFISVLTVAFLGTKKIRSEMNS